MSTRNRSQTDEIEECPAYCLFVIAPLGAVLFTIARLHWFSILSCWVVAFNILGCAQTSVSMGQESATWIRPTKLIEQVESVKRIPQATQWSHDTLAILEAIGETPADSRQELMVLFNQLNAQRDKIQAIANSVWHAQVKPRPLFHNASFPGNSQVSIVRQISRIANPQTPPLLEGIQEATEIARIAYRIERRMAIWVPIAQGNLSSLKLSDGTTQSASFSQISIHQLDPGWVEYLRLKEFKRTFGAISPNAAEQKKVSRDILARIYSPVLQPSQSEFIRSAIDPSIIHFLKRHASQPVDRIDLLKRMERYEDSPSGLSSYYLNDDYQNLLWSANTSDRALAQQIHSHYRNANFRLSVSQRLLNRMIPELPITSVPVSETIKGARVSGQSWVQNNFAVALEPNPNQMVLKLQTNGQVRADTIARTNNFRVTNQGDANFQVFQRIAIGPGWIDSSERPSSSTSGNQNVVGLESKLDKVPVVGWMARRLAENKLRDDAPETNQLFRQKVQDSVETQMKAEVEKYINKLRYYSYTYLFQPLVAMDLEPEAIQMATTSDQVVMRYRLAGRDQMAANSSRPQDNGTSLLSFQMHQSAVNNAIARVGLNGNTFTIDELKKHLQEVIGSTQIASDKSDESEESEQWAEIGFGKLDPIQFDFDENRLNITLNLKSLQVAENGKKFKNVSLGVSYKAKVQGTQIVLEQDDLGTSIKGQKRLKFGEKASVSTIMKVLFKKQYLFNALPEKMHQRIGGHSLEISQLILSDGWMGVSLDDPQTQQPNNGQARVGTLRRILKRQ